MPNSLLMWDNTAMRNIWKELSKPILALAPMEDVTDTVFRRIVASCAKPDITFTEFTNCDGLVSVGREVVSHRLRFTPEEHPIVAQIWGMKPENYLTVARELVDMGFDGIDINMGCPEKSVVGHGACSALVDNPTLAREIIMATKEGANGKIPVSVKTRIGFKKIVTEEWISHILSCGIDALTVHGRTAMEMSKPPVHWDEVAKVVAIRNDMKLATVILGNGDIKNAHEALEKITLYGLDGIMMGRAVFDDLYAFDRGEKHEMTLSEQLEIMKHHVELFEKTWGAHKNYAILRKFFKIYVRGFEGAGEWREKVMSTKTPAEVYPLIAEMMRMIQ
jgi:nifR3 family TIM-barrel protein